VNLNSKDLEIPWESKFWHRKAVSESFCLWTLWYTWALLWLHWEARFHASQHQVT